MGTRRALSAGELLGEARARGVGLRACGERLVLDGPEAAVNALRPALRAAKADLLALLRARAWPMPVAGQVPVPGTPYYLRGCWRLFPESQLTVVDEPLGRGFRCARCLCSAWLAEEELGAVPRALGLACADEMAPFSRTGFGLLGR